MKMENDTAAETMVMAAFNGFHVTDAQKADVRFQAVMLREIVKEVFTFPDGDKGTRLSLWITGREALVTKGTGGGYMVILNPQGGDGERYDGMSAKQATEFARAFLIR